ncbi:MAG: YqfO family protein [Pseudomonadales bacterium]|nr:YqfO family protein [Pseudomonadales bacterium]
MYKIAVFVPDSHLEVVKASLFAAGAGKIGNYDCCCWQSKGEGQFRPLSGSQPFIGEKGVVETVEEWKLELVCNDDVLNQVIAAMKRAHPYEEPAFDVWQLHGF